MWFEFAVGTILTCDTLFWLNQIARCIFIYIRFNANANELVKRKYLIIFFSFCRLGVFYTLKVISNLTAKRISCRQSGNNYLFTHFRVLKRWYNMCTFLYQGIKKIWYWSLYLPEMFVLHNQFLRNWWHGMDIWFHMSHS